MNNKAAIELSATGSIILLLIITFLLMLVVGGVISVYATTSDTIECQWSQILRDIAPMGNTLFDLSCPRRYIRVDDNRLEIAYTLLGDRVGSSAPYSYPYFDGERITARNTVSDADELNALVAHEMSRCWELFARGERDVIGDHVVFPRLKEKSTCIICTELAVRQSFETSQVTLYDYLSSTPAPLFGGAEMSYLSHLYQPLGTNEPYECAREQDDETAPHSLESMHIDPEEHYVVFSVRRGHGTAWTWIRNLFSDEDAAYCQTTLIQPVTELAETCDFIIN